MSRNLKRSNLLTIPLGLVILGTVLEVCPGPVRADAGCESPSHVLVLEPLHPIESSTESGTAVPAVASVRMGGREIFEIAVAPVRYAETSDPIRSGASDGGSVEIRIVRFGGERGADSLEGVRVCQALSPDGRRARIPVHVDGPDQGSRHVPAPIVAIPARSVTDGVTVAAISATLWQGSDCDGRSLASSSYNPATAMLVWNPRLAGPSACSPTAIWLRREAAVP